MAKQKSQIVKVFHVLNFSVFCGSGSEGGGKDGLGRKGSMMVGVERTERLKSCSSPSDEEDKWG